MLRILFSGDNWYGSNARSCVDALRRLGCDVLDIDIQTFIPQVKLPVSRALRRILMSRLTHEFNNQLLDMAKVFRPDIFVAFKGNWIQAETLKLLSGRGISLYNYFPDTSAFSHGNWLPKSLPEYNCVFYTKPFWYADVTKQINLQDAFFLPHGYDPGLHRPVILNATDISEYECDVSLIAMHTQHKESTLEKLISLRPNLNLCIWGNGWADRCQARELRKFIKGFPLLGESYTRALQAARINLAVMSGRVVGATSGDLTTNRTYTIPASGGFMVHERNPEVLDLYEENEEIVCFDSTEELAAKIDYYLAHPEERIAIAQAAHRRCVPAYSYDNRVAQILRWHYEHRGAGNPAAPEVEVEVS
jgi:spore maturation protein CgeB